jgi:predicted PurR-regulated permease PerM
MLAADFSAADLAAVIVAIASVVAVMLLVLVVVSVNRTLTTLRLTIEQFRRETLPVVDDLHRTVTTANAELERLDGLLDSATSVSSTVDSASHLVYLAFSNPLIKAMALATGTAKAAKALRRS